MNSKGKISTFITNYTNAIFTISQYAANNTNTAPSISDYLNAGVIGVDKNNLSLVNIAIDDSNSTGTDNASKIQGLVNLSLFTINTIPDTNITENTIYTGVTPTVVGTSSGTLTYTHSHTLIYTCSVHRELVRGCT